MNQRIFLTSSEPTYEPKMTINFIINGTEAEISQKQYFQTSKSQEQIVNYISDYVFST